MGWGLGLVGNGGGDSGTSAIHSVPGAAWRAQVLAKGIAHLTAYALDGHKKLSRDCCCLSKPLVRMRGTGQLSEPNFYNKQCAKHLDFKSAKLH